MKIWFSTYRVCYIVAEAFIDNPNQYKLIKFKDKNHLNIHKNNLEWTDNPYDSEEMWEPLKNFSKYEICRKGIIRNVKTKLELKPYNMESGYSVIILSDDDNKSTDKYVHKLVAEQFISNPDNLPEVNHKNGNKNDYSIENLECISPSDNSRHAIKTGLKQTTLGKGKNMELLDEDNNVIKTFSSVKETINYVKCTDFTLRKLIRDNKFGDNTCLINGHRVRYKIYHDLDQEVWKNVNTEFSSVNEMYQVSSHGRVRNKLGIVMSNHICNGYQRLNLAGAPVGKSGNFFVHCLVAFSFLEFDESMRSHDVNHIDKNTINNHISNLEILDKKEHNRKDRGKRILGFSKNSKYVIFNARSTAGEVLGTDGQNITSAINRKGSCKSYKWFTLDSEEAQEIIKNYEQDTSIQGQLSSIDNEI